MTLCFLLVFLHLLSDYRVCDVLFILMYRKKSGNNYFKMFINQDEWLATWARKTKVPGSSAAADYGRGELSLVITRLMSSCL